MQTLSNIRNIKGAESRQKYIKENTFSREYSWVDDEGEPRVATLKIYPDNLPGVGWVLERKGFPKHVITAQGQDRKFYRYREDAYWEATVTMIEWRPSLPVAPYEPNSPSS